MHSKAFANVDWEGFKLWLLHTHAERNAGDIYRTAKKYCMVLWLPSEASKLSALSSSSCRLVMASLANLSKFLGMYKVWKDIVANAGLKWSNGNSEDVIIKRFTKQQNSDDILCWVKSVKENSPNLSCFMDLAAATGIRFIEAVNSYNLIVNLSSKDNLAEYYAFGRELLQHYRFKALFMRKSKKVFISFVSSKLIRKIEGSSAVSKEAIENRIKRSPYPSRFGDLREYWATVMTRHLSQPEIDFLQGRVSSSVFMRNYFNPAWITDLQERTLKASEEILHRLKGLT